MGIDGLLNLLRPVTKKEHISTFRDKKIGIDAMPWIYKGCYSCTYELNQEIESVNFLYYLLQMLDMLQFYNIKPIFVFDGRSLPMKKQTLDKRIKTKEQYKQKGLQCLKNGQYEEGRKYLSRCIIIDQRILSSTMRCLKTKNIPFIVAPYEADTQLAKLKHLNMIDAVISEDSDLLVYGVNVLFKLNQSGQCDYVDINECSPKHATNQFLKLYLKFPHRLRVDAAILAGSDYHPSIKGIGIKRAIKLLYKKQNIKNVIDHLRKQKVYAHLVPTNYQQSIEKVQKIFSLATTFNPETQKLESLFPQQFKNFDHANITKEDLYHIIGKQYQFSLQVSKGQLNVKTLEKRELEPLHFREVVPVNRQNLLMHQMVNKQRRQDEKQLFDKLQRQNDLKQQQQNDKNGQNKTKAKKKKEKIQLTEEQMIIKKQQRRTRIIRLNNLMNSKIGDLDLDEEEDCPEEKVSSIEDDSKSSKDRANEQQQLQNQVAEVQDPQQVEQQSNFSALQILNPFTTTYFSHNRQDFFKPIKISEILNNQ